MRRKVTEGFNDISLWFFLSYYPPFFQFQVLRLEASATLLWAPSKGHRIKNLRSVFWRISIEALCCPLNNLLFYAAFIKPRNFLTHCIRSDGSMSIVFASRADGRCSTPHQGLILEKLSHSVDSVSLIGKSFRDKNATLAPPGFKIAVRKGGPLIRFCSEIFFCHFLTKLWACKI